MKHLTAGLAVALTVASIVARAENASWPQFRGPDANPVGAHVQLPERWSTTENVDWKVEIPGRGMYAIRQKSVAAEYAVDPAASSMTITVGKSGLFKFAGHTHEIVAPVAEGRVTADVESLAASSVTLAFRSSELKVTGKGEPPGDVPKVQEAMLGPKVLDSARFPAIGFRSTAVSGRSSGPGAWDVEVRGDLTLHGATRGVVLPLRVELSQDTLLASGTTTLKQRDFGIKPLSVAGVVNVKDELRLEFRITARAVALQ